MVTSYNSWERSDITYALLYMDKGAYNCQTLTLWEGNHKKAMIGDLKIFKIKIINFYKILTIRFSLYIIIRMVCQTPKKCITKKVFVSHNLWGSIKGTFSKKMLQRGVNFKY